ncbi:hypothetical protein EPN52_01205 [bacterium]|nr:MAG: hypothetical protein EPN52_01205 [bacterium]
MEQRTDDLLAALHDELARVEVAILTASDVEARRLRGHHRRLLWTVAEVQRCEERRLRSYVGRLLGTPSPTRLRRIPLSLN